MRTTLICIGWRMNSIAEISLYSGALFVGQDLPVRVSPRQGAVTFGEAAAEIHAVVAEHLERVGGVLFRGFAVEEVTAFKQFAASFGHPLLSYEFGSTPRSKVEQGIYTSTEYPAHQSIPLHNEQAYTLQWPMRIWFYCETPAAEGGETPIADSRKVYRRIDPKIRERFITKGLMYVRNYGNGLDVPWRKVFNTDDPKVVEVCCREQNIAWEWKGDGELRTRQLCQAVATHPRTGDVVLRLMYPPQIQIVFTQFINAPSWFK